MVYGVTSEEEEWSHKGQCLHPRKYDSKIKLFHERFSGEPVQEGTEQEVGKGGLGIQPDLIIVNTVLWDLATANLRDAKAEVTAKEQLDWKFLEEFRTKTIDLMRLIDKLWPNAAKMYRPNHAMRHGSDGVWWVSLIL